MKGEAPPGMKKKVTKVRKLIVAEPIVVTGTSASDVAYWQGQKQLKALHAKDKELARERGGRKLGPAAVSQQAADKLEALDAAIRQLFSLKPQMKNMPAIDIAGELWEPEAQGRYWPASTGRKCPWGGEATLEARVKAWLAEHRPTKKKA